jgi:O-antigen ligase
MALLAAGSGVTAAYWHFSVLAVLLLVNLAQGRFLSNLSLIVALLPSAMLLRDFFFYNSIIALLVFGIGMLMATSRDPARTLMAAGLHVVGFVAGIYWLLSFQITGDYYTNLRIFEVLLTAAAILLLAQHRLYLAGALRSLAVTIGSVGLGLLFSGLAPRLGMGRLDGVRFGNPFALGIPATFLLLMVVADGGRLMLLKRRGLARLIVVASMGSLVLLSTSRAGWLVGAGGLAIMFALDRRHRLSAIASGGILAAAVALLLNFEQGAPLADALDRTFSSERSLSNRTSGRSEQWDLFFRVFPESPIWGFGPGTGPDVYAAYSAVDPEAEFRPGQAFQWHSLYMHVGIETGLIGYLCLLFLLASLLRSSALRWRRAGEVHALLGTAGLLLICLTANGMDASTGLFLGVAMVSRVPRRRTPLPSRESRNAEAARDDGPLPGLAPLLRKRW